MEMKLWIDFKRSLPIVAATSPVFIVLLMKFGFIQLQASSAALFLSGILNFIYCFYLGMELDKEDDINNAKKVYYYFSIISFLCSIPMALLIRNELL